MAGRGSAERGRARHRPARPGARRARRGLHAGASRRRRRRCRRGSARRPHRNGRRCQSDCAIAAMCELGAEPSRMQAFTGPGVCGACYEVPEALRAEVAAKEPASRSATRQGTPAIDVPAAVSAQLRRAGVEATVTRVADGCTMENPQYFSYRRDGAPAGSPASSGSTRAEARWLTRRPYPSSKRTLPRARRESQGSARPDRRRLRRGRPAGRRGRADRGDEVLSRR